MLWPGVRRFGGVQAWLLTVLVLARLKASFCYERKGFLFHRLRYLCKPWSFHGVLGTFLNVWDQLPGSLIRKGLDGLMYNLMKSRVGFAKPLGGKV